jgi:hypothetical protein
MGILIEEIKKIPERAEQAVELVDGATTTVVEKTEPYVNWENVVNSIDQSHVIIALTIFLIAIFAKPILSLAKYIVIFGVILFLVQHYA